MTFICVSHSLGYPKTPIKHLHISIVKIVVCIVFRVDLFIVQYQNQLVHKTFYVFFFYMFLVTPVLVNVSIL